MRTRQANPYVFINIEMRTRSDRPCVSMALGLFLQKAISSEVIPQICHPPRSFRPFFDRAKADMLFKQIIGKFGNGRYLPDGPVDSGGWNDLLGNIAAPALLRRDVLIRGMDKTNQGKLYLTMRALKASYLELKALEDWIFYNRDKVLKAMAQPGE